MAEYTSVGVFPEVRVWLLMVQPGPLQVLGGPHLRPQSASRRGRSCDAESGGEVGLNTQRGNNGVIEMNIIRDRSWREGMQAAGKK